MSLGVSIVISTHDRPDSLTSVFDSVLRQTLPPRQIIVVNDGGLDVPAELSDRARAAGIAFRHERLDTASLTASRNRGLALADGDVVLLMDDDGALPPDYLARLAELYQADHAGLVAGIGGVMDDPGLRAPAKRLWLALAHLMARGPWSPARCAARYVRLPAALAGRLRPARWLSGGAISLRGQVAATERFEERFCGYALYEDREFCLRVGRRRALFLAPQLRVRHAPQPTGRPNTRRHGRMYVAHWLHIVRRSLGSDAGSWVLLGYDILGASGLYAAWAAMTLRRKNLLFVLGMFEELARQAAGALRRIVFGETSPADASARA